MKNKTEENRNSLNFGFDDDTTNFQYLNLKYILTFFFGSGHFNTC